jgi:hypothetical protein
MAKINSEWDAVDVHENGVSVPAFLAPIHFGPIRARRMSFLVTASWICRRAVIFSAAWVSYKTEKPFYLEKWLLVLVLALAIGALIPLRFFNAVGIGICAAVLAYLFLFLTNELLLSTAWMQAVTALALFIFCAVAYFREQLLWAFFRVGD